MTVFVVLEFCKGRIGLARVYLRPESAEQARRKWLREHGSKDDSCVRTPYAAAA